MRADPPPGTTRGEGIRLALGLLAVVFAAEIVVMLSISRLPRVGDLGATLLDASLLSLLIAPFLWWAVVRPDRLRARSAERRAENRIEHLNRVYAVLSEINQAIVRVREPRALFAEACRIAVEVGHFRMAWIGLVDEATKTLMPVAHAGHEEGYISRLQIDLEDPRGGEGPSGHALHGGQRVVYNDLEHGATNARWQADAVAMGYRAAAAFPLTLDGRTVGTFALFAAKKDFFDEKELRLLDEMAADLSFAIAMAQVEDARLRLATAIEQSPVSVVITNADGRIEYVNPAFSRITGYSSEEAMGANPRILNSGVQSRETYDDLWATIRSGSSWTGELINKRKDGTLYTQELTIAPVRESGGATRFVAISLDVTERKRAEEELQGSVRDKEALLKEVHHRVKNNLQVIISLLRLEWSRIDHGATRVVLKDMQNRIQSMAALHETLYRSGNFAEADLAGYLGQLSGQLMRSMEMAPGQVELNLDLTGASVDLEQAIPCGLIVNELLSNALKHGFPDGRRGMISIELSRVDDGRLRLRITDDGVGLPADFETRRTGSLGLQLVSDLARQIQGGFTVGPGPQKVFEVVFTPKHPQVIGRSPSTR